MPIARTAESLDSRDLPPMDVIYGKSSIMAAVREKLERVADTGIPVLLQGESGTGKEIFAKLLHLCSRQSQFAWVKVTCPAIPFSLIESELFGYEKGAFTGAYGTKRGQVERAHQGTLFLDEVGSLDLSVQAKLLQVLQDGSFMRVGAQESRKVNIRVVCAANENLRQQTEDGSFRLDFLFRINAVTIELPPLRQRATDLPVLIDYFFERYSRVYGLDPKPLSREITGMMQRFSWPGNIRQLENVVRSYVLIGTEESLAAEMLPAVTTAIIPDIDLAKPISLKEFTKAAKLGLEREIILKVLQANGWNRRKTAEWLNISYRSLLYKLQNEQAPGAPDKPARARTSATPPIRTSVSMTSHSNSPRKTI